MKIEQLIQVIEIAKTKSITLAAKNLYMSQSNLSTSIRELEKEMNKQIFVRSNNGTQITPFGEKFLEQAKSIIKQFEYVKNMSEDQNQKSIHFCVSSYFFLFTAYILEDFFNKNKETHMVFDLRDCSRSEVIENVASKETEIGILSIPSWQKNKLNEVISHKGLEYNKITEEPTFILVGSKSPLYSFRGAIDMTELNRMPIIEFSEKNKNFLSLEHEHLKILDPDTITYVSDRGSLLHFLNSTPSYHIATKNIKAYRKYLFHDNLKAIPIRNCPFSMEIGWIKEKDYYLSVLGKEFLTRVHELLTLENFTIVD